MFRASVKFFIEESEETAYSPTYYPKGPLPTANSGSSSTIPSSACRARRLRWAFRARRRSLSFSRVCAFFASQRARLARGDREGLAAVEEEEGRDLAPTRVGQLGALHLRPAREAEVVVARPAATLLHVVLGLRTTTRARFARADGAGRATREREGGGDLAPLGVGQLGALRHHPRREPAIVVSRPAANLHVLEGGQRLHDLAPSDLEVRAAPRLSNCAATEAHVATGPVSATSLASFTSSNGPWPIIRAVYSRSHLE